MTNLVVVNVVEIKFLFCPLSMNSVNFQVFARSFVLPPFRINPLCLVWVVIFYIIINQKVVVLIFYVISQSIDDENQMISTRD